MNYTLNFTVYLKFENGDLQSDLVKNLEERFKETIRFRSIDHLSDQGEYQVTEEFQVLLTDQTADKLKMTLEEQSGIFDDDFVSQD